jgi:hypothetical protein
VISGNGGAGVVFSEITDEDSLSGNTVAGNYIGVTESGTQALGNLFAGVFVDNLGTNPSNEIIGGAAPGAGNIIAGTKGGYGIDIYGPAASNHRAGNLVAGNLVGIGLNDTVFATAYNDTGTYLETIGIYIQNSNGNMIGGGNVISGNSLAGVEITGEFASGNMVAGNEIGTNAAGNGIVSIPGTGTDNLPFDYMNGNYQIQPSLTQQNGVYLLGATSNVIGGTAPGAANVIGNNLSGVNITGQEYASNGGVPVGYNVVEQNYIGISSGPNSIAVPNFEHGVLIDDSGSNTIGGVNAGNWIEANGIDGVEIFGGAVQTASGSSGGTGSNGKNTNAPPQRNVIISNYIGFNVGFASGERVALPAARLSAVSPDGPAIRYGAQLYGVVVIGSSGNVIGEAGRGKENLIGGNSEIGVYISRDDFQFNVYSEPVGNTVKANIIENNPVYGVLRYEAPGNVVALGRGRTANKFKHDGIDLADYLKGINQNTSLTRPKAKRTHKSTPPAPPSPRGTRVKDRAFVAEHRAKAEVITRPRVPALFRAGAKSVVVEHKKSHHK